MWVQAPEHVVENLVAEEKAAAKGRKKVVKKSQPERGYAHWTKDTFDKLVAGEPEALQSHFHVNHQMVMSLLDRPVEYDDRVDPAEHPDGLPIDGCAALRRLVTSNHEPRKRQRDHIRRTIAIYRSLVAADLLEFPPEPDEHGRSVRVNFDLSDEFALHQPLSLWAVEAVGRLGAAEREAAAAEVGGDATEVAVEIDPTTHALNLLSIVEAVQEGPGVILAAQVKRARDELMAEMKAAGVEYEERMERLAQVEHPKPNRDWVYADFDAFRARHPWVGSDNVQPKSIAREMLERALTFGEYVQDYGLKRSEGVLLRYLSDVYKGLVQNVPGEHRTEELDDIVAWLGAVVRQVDSSLIDEWERLLHPDAAEAAPDAVRPGVEASGERSIVDDERAFGVLVRNRLFDWVQRLARRTGYDELVADAADRGRWPSGDAIESAMAPYWDEFDEILLDGDARSRAMFGYDRSSGEVTQIIHDPEYGHEWRITAAVDLAASAEQGRAVVRLVGLGPTG